MRYFFDTEFIEDGHTIDLLSIGIVADDGREYYAENREAAFSRASAWVQTNVLPHLDTIFHPDQAKHRATIRDDLWHFCDPAVYGPSEFWTYYGAYDWVALCQLFGTMTDLPRGWPYFAYDLRQWLNHLGHADVKQPDDAPHHALSDARWIAETYRQYSH